MYVNLAFSINEKSSVFSLALSFDIAKSKRNKPNLYKQNKRIVKKI